MFYIEIKKTGMRQERDGLPGSMEKQVTVSIIETVTVWRNLIPYEEEKIRFSGIGESGFKCGAIKNAIEDLITNVIKSHNAFDFKTNIISEIINSLKILEKEDYKLERVEIFKKDK